MHEPPRRSIANSRILIVDDNRGAAELHAEILRMSGFHPACAYDGPEGLKAAAQLVPDLVVLNMGMPGMTGLECMRLLRADARLRHAKVVITSGYAHIEAEVRAAGADAFLPMPSSITRIKDVVLRLLGHAREVLPPPPSWLTEKTARLTLRDLGVPEWVRAQVQCTLELKLRPETELFSTALTAEELSGGTLEETLQRFVERKPASFQFAYRVTSLPLSLNLTHCATGALSRCSRGLAVERLEEMEGYDPHGRDANSTLFRLWTRPDGGRLLTVFGRSAREARERHQNVAKSLRTIKRSGYKLPSILDDVMMDMVNSTAFAGLTAAEEDAWMYTIIYRQQSDWNLRRYWEWTPRLEALRRFADSPEYLRLSQNRRDREIARIIRKTQGN